MRFEGYHPSGPFAPADLSREVVYRMTRHGDNLSEIRIVRGSDVRPDMANYPNLYMVFTKLKKP